MWTPPADHPIRRLFAGLTEHAFQTSLGVADPPLIDYLSELLARCLHMDAIYRLRNIHGQPLDQVVDMILEADGLPPEGRTRREVHRHIGDFTLFWTGLYPEAVNRMRSRACKDYFVDYCKHGKRSYLIASSIADEANREQSAILKRLGEQFELCAYGLSQVRREWETLKVDPQQPMRLLG
jgi:hypothetical protein